MPYVFKISIVIHQNLRTSKQSCEKILAMLIFDVSHMTEKVWRCSIFQVDHAISFKGKWQQKILLSHLKETLKQ